MTPSSEHTPKRMPLGFKIPIIVISLLMVLLVLASVVPESITDSCRFRAKLTNAQCWRL